MEFTFKVVDSEGSEEFIRFIETLDFVEPVSSPSKNGKTKKKSRVKKLSAKKSSNIIPAKNPKGNPVKLRGGFDHYKSISEFRESVWGRK